MRTKTIATTVLLLSCLHATAATSKGALVAMEIEVDGHSMAKPSLWQESGATGEVAVRDQFRVRVTTTLKEETAYVQFELFTTQTGVESKAGAPRVITKIGERSSLAWSGADGKSYQLSVLVSETKAPPQ